MAPRMTTPIQLDDDDNGLINKVMQKRLDQLRLKDGVEAAGFVTNFMPFGQVLSVPLAAAEGELSRQDKEADYRRRFGNLDRVAYSGHGVRRTLAKLRDRAKDNMGEAIFSGATGFAGAAATGLLALSGPVGWAVGLGGMAGGTYAGTKIYNKFFNKETQDPLILAKKVDQMRSRKEPVPVELVFAVLAANLQEKMGSVVDNKLEMLTGTRYFHEAIVDPKNAQKFAALMNDRRIDGYIRANMLLPFDAANPNKTVAEQLTDLINRKPMPNQKPVTARDLLEPSARLIQIVAENNMQIMRERGVNPQKSVPQVDYGTTVTPGNATQLPLPSSNGHHPSRKF